MPACGFGLRDGGSLSLHRASRNLRTKSAPALLLYVCSAVLVGAGTQLAASIAGASTRAPKRRAMAGPSSECKSDFDLLSPRYDAPCIRHRCPALPTAGENAVVMLTVSSNSRTAPPSPISTTKHLSGAPPSIKTTALRSDGRRPNAGRSGRLRNADTVFDQVQQTRRCRDIRPPQRPKSDEH